MAELMIPYNGATTYYKDDNQSGPKSLETVPPEGRSAKEEVATDTVLSTSGSQGQEAFKWPARKKWTVTLLTCFVTMIVGVNSTSITAAASLVNEQFNVSDRNFPNSFWPVTAWNCGAALAPMIALPIMEAQGMRTAYLICYGLFAIFVVPQAVASNFATLITCRFFAGCFGGILQDVMDGIIADIWASAEERSLPVTIYVFSLIFGVTLGPVLGGGIVSTLDWRWIFYIQLIIYVSTFPFVVAMFKETRPPNILASHSASQSNPFSLQFFRDAAGLPTYLLCTEPVVFLFTLLSALSYGLVYLGTQSVTQVYSTLHQWQEYQAGLVQISLLIGEVLGFFACLFQNRLYAKKSRSTSLPSQSVETLVAEARLYLSIPGCLLGLTGGLLWYGWTSYATLHWSLPSVGLALVGFGSVTVMQAIMMYITDAYEKYAASASAAVCFGENIFAAFLPLASASLYRRLGFHWASSLLAFIALALSLGPVLLLRKGREVRKRSPFMKKASYG